MNNDRIRAAAEIHDLRRMARSFRRYAAATDAAGHGALADPDRRHAAECDREAAALAAAHHLPLDVDPLDLRPVAADPGWAIGPRTPGALR